VTDRRQLFEHHDDLGGSHSANVTLVELNVVGVVTCGSVTATAPWFSEIADLARQRLDPDIGVHLPLHLNFPCSAGSTLVDCIGSLWPDNARACSADPEEVRAELDAQILTALHAGIDATHMGTVW
jgi:chitin disaccharide deacetylase